MSRLSTTISKEFFLGHDWTPELASFLDHFCDEVAENTVAVRTGTYVGNGIAHAVSISDLPQPPIFAVLQPSIGGTPFVTLVPSLAGAITAWTRTGFTLSASGAYNTALTAYRYLVLA